MKSSVQKILVCQQGITIKRPTKWELWGCWLEPTQELAMPTILTLHLQHSPPLNKGCGQRTFLSQSPHPMHTSGEKERKEEDKYVAHTVQHQSSGAVSKSQTRAPIPNSSYSLCGRKATLKKYSMVTSADIIISWDAIAVCINKTTRKE